MLILLASFRKSVHLLSPPWEQSVGISVLVLSPLLLLLEKTFQAFQLFVLEKVWTGNTFMIAFLFLATPQCCPFCLLDTRDLSWKSCKKWRRLYNGMLIPCLTAVLCWIEFVWGTSRHFYKISKAWDTRNYSARAMSPVALYPGFWFCHYQKELPV